MAELTAAQVIANLTRAGYAPTQQQLQRATAAGFDVGVPAPAIPPPLAPFTTSPARIPSPISVNNLSQEVTPFQLPQTPTPTDYGTILAGIPEIALPSREETATETRQKSLLERFLGTTQELGKREEEQLKAEKAAGIDEQQRQLLELNTQIKNLQNEALAIPLQIQQEFQARGATQQGIAPIQAGRLRENAIKALTVSSLAESVRGNLVMAQDKVDRAIKLQFADEEANIKYLATAIDLNYKDLAREDKERADALKIKLDIRESLLSIYKENTKTAQAMANIAVKNNPDNSLAVKAAQEVYSLDVSDKDYLKKAFNLVGQYQSDPLAIKKAILEHEKLQADIQEIKTKTRITGTLAALDPESATFTLDSIKASKGGKTPTGEQTKPLNKALLVVSQLETLQSQIASIDTGPILGILKGINPYDVKAQLLKATLQATVPNLARGVYGEVGVLTDNDIKNYIQTLPNIRSKKELSDLVLSMTLKTVKNAVDSNLQVLAAEGRDISGFEPIYIRLQKKVDEIEKRIGIQGNSVAKNEQKIINGHTYISDGTQWVLSK